MTNEDYNMILPIKEQEYDERIEGHNKNKRKQK
jgi:hypothetical protein